MTRIPVTKLSVPDLGAYLREQREAAQLSLRQLSEIAGVSNPYLSQIERGLRRPSAEILSALAKGLEISAESLYVRAGFLDEESRQPDPDSGVEAAIEADPALTPRQRRLLIDHYHRLTGESAPSAGRSTSHAARAATPSTRRHAPARRQAPTTTARSTS